MLLLLCIRLIYNAILYPRFSCNISGNVECSDTLVPYSARILYLVTFVWLSSSCYSFAVISCGNLTDPRNGHVKVESTRYQGIAKYECSSGYELLGQDVRTCQISGQWSGTHPQCNGKSYCYGFHVDIILL